MGLVHPLLSLESLNCMIGISVSGRTEEVVDALKSAKEKAAKTIMITATKVYENEQYYDELILIGGLKNLAVSDKISPQIPALIVIDMYTHYLHYNSEQKKEKLNLTLEYIDYELE